MISELTRSDSGLYRLGLGESSSSAEICNFRLHLVEALLDGSKDHHLYKDAGSSLTGACSFGSSGSSGRGQFCRGKFLLGQMKADLIVANTSFCMKVEFCMCPSPS